MHLRGGNGGLEVAQMTEQQPQLSQVLIGDDEDARLSRQHADEHDDVDIAEYRGAKGAEVATPSDLFRRGDEDIEASGEIWGEAAPPDDTREDSLGVGVRNQPRRGQREDRPLDVHRVHFVNRSRTPARERKA